MHILFLLPLVRICHGYSQPTTSSSAVCMTPVSCTYSVTLPNPVGGHGSGWSFSDQSEDDNTQIIWEYDTDGMGDLFIHFSNKYQFKFTATITSPDGNDITTFTMQPNDKNTFPFPTGEDWLGDTIRVRLDYTRSLPVRRLKGRSSSLITRDPAPCNICIVLHSI